MTTSFAPRASRPRRTVHGGVIGSRPRERPLTPSNVGGERRRRPRSIRASATRTMSAARDRRAAPRCAPPCSRRGCDAAAAPGKLAGADADVAARIGRAGRASTRSAPATAAACRRAARRRRRRRGRRASPAPAGARGSATRSRARSSAGEPQAAAAQQRPRRHAPWPTRRAERQSRRGAAPRRGVMRTKTSAVS